MNIGLFQTLNNKCLSMVMAVVLFCSPVLAQVPGAGGGESVRHRILPAASEALIDQVVERGVLRVGLATFEPWVMKKPDGKLYGYDIDVSRKLASELGVEVAFMEFAWEALLPALLDEKIDIIISGLTMTTSRNLKVNFTLPYSNSGVQLLVSRHSPRKLESLKDVNQPSVTLVLVKDTVYVALARERFPEVRVLLVDAETQALEVIKSGKADATMATTPVPERLAARYPRQFFMPVYSQLQRYSEAFAIRKGDPDSLNVLNNWIVQRLEDGWLQQRRDYWFTEATKDNQP
ncbi:MAG: transporter substrate-binding domain-containing protein [Endozoicomonas sp.]